MHDRRAALAAAMRPGTKEQIGKLIAYMFLGFAARPMTEIEAQQTLAVYVTQLQRFPAWVVKKACEGLMRPSKKVEFAPSVATVFAACEAEVAWCWKEAREIADVLDAEVYVEPDESERQRVKQGFDRLVEDLTRAMAPEGVPKRRSLSEVTPAEAETNLKRIEAAHLPPPELSAALRASLSLSESPRNPSDSDRLSDEMREVI